MTHDILLVAQLVFNLSTLFVAGFMVGKLYTAERDIKRYRQMQEQAERETKKYANR